MFLRDRPLDVDDVDRRAVLCGDGEDGIIAALPPRLPQVRVEVVDVEPILRLGAQPVHVVLRHVDGHAVPQALKAQDAGLPKLFPVLHRGRGLRQVGRNAAVDAELGRDAPCVVRPGGVGEGQVHHREGLARQEVDGGGVRDLRAVFVHRHGEPHDVRALLGVHLVHDLPHHLHPIDLAGGGVHDGLLRDVDVVGFAAVHLNAHLHPQLVVHAGGLWEGNALHPHVGGRAE